MADISALTLKVDSSGVHKAASDLNEFAKSAKGAAGETNPLNDAFSNMNLDSLAAAAGVTALVAAAYKLTSALAGAAKASIQMYSHFEQMENGLVTVFQSAEKGKEVFEDLRKFSFDTTFGVDELADAATQLYNVGMAEDEVKNKLKMLGDLAGGQKQKFAELVSVYGKIVSTGKAGSMQMQQLALRGIPIRQELEKIGVTGTATAEQITQAFENMTAEGGRFHNAMENIIDTIEGKEGFLSDTLKEMQVNFADASGMAEAYKSVLDILYGAVQKITDALAAINNNPVAKAVFQGVLLASLGATATVLTTAIVPALAAVITKLGIIAALKAAINPTSLLIGVGVGVAALGLAKAVEYSNKINATYNELLKTKKDLEKKEKDETATFEEQLELQKVKMQLAEEEIRRKEKVSGDTTGQKDQIQKDAVKEAQKAFEIERDKYEEMLKQKETMEYYAKIYKNVISEAERLKQITEESNQKYQTAVELAEQLYKQTKEGRIEALKTQKALLQQASYGRLETVKDKNGREYLQLKANTPQVQKEIDVALAEIEKKLNAAYNEGKTTVKVKVDASDVKSDLEQAWADHARTAVMQQMGFATISDRGQTFQKAMEAQVRALMDKRDELSAKGGKDEEIAKIDEKIAAYGEQISQMERLKNVYGQLQNQMTDFFMEMGANQQVAELFSSSLTSIISTQIPNTLVNSFQSIGKALGQGADAGEAMKEVMRSFMTQLMSQLSATCIQAGVMLIAQSGWAGVPPALALFALGGVAGIGAGIMGSIGGGGNEAEQRQKEQLELLKAINEQYKNLYTALKEEEAYYLEKKRQINSSGVNAAAGVTSVNDMVITPYGNFSTSPKDYLFAMEHPESLMGGQMNMSVTINNTMGDSANVTAQRSVGPDGQQQLVVMISKKIAQDYASGMNGWDSAIDYNSMRRQGRSLA